MNFKLLTFIFVIIGVQSINSSIIGRQSIDDLVQISNLNGEVLNVNAGEKNPYGNLKSLTFNISDTVIMNRDKYPEIECVDFYKQGFCTRGNGKYQARIIKCENLEYPNDVSFQCKLFNAKVINKNVQYKNAYDIACLNEVTQETAKGMCRIQYTFAYSTSYDEADDVENEEDEL